MRKNTWLWVVPVLLLATWLGARNLNADTLWYDEFWSIYNAGGAHDGPLSPAEVWARVADQDPWQAPGYYLLLSGWGALVGWTVYAGRALSLFIGVLAMAWTYRIGRDIASPFAGFAAALTLGLSAFFIYYLHELRAYTLYALFTALSLWAYGHIISARIIPHRRVYLAFTVGIVGLLYTHYLAALVVVAIGLYHLLFAPKNRRWWHVTALMALAGILFLPWLNVVLRAVSNVSDDPSRRFFAQGTAVILSDLLGNFSNQNVALVALFGWYALRQLNPLTRLIVFMTIVAFALTALFNQFVPFISNSRYLMALWPLLAVVIGLGAASMARSRLKPGVVLAIWAAGYFWLTITVTPPEPSDSEWVTYLAWDTMAEQMQPYAHAGDALVFYLPRYVPNWIHDPLARYYLHNVPVDIHLLESLTDKTPDEFTRHSQEFTQDAPRVWVAWAPQYAPSPLARAALEGVLDERFLRCGVFHESPEMRLDFYVRASEEGAQFRFGDDIELTLLEPLPETVSGALQVVANWSAEIPAGQYSAGLHVDDAQGNFVAQTDFGLPTSPPDCHLATITLDALPPGQYTLYALVYNQQTGERLPATRLDSAEQGERLAIGEFSIR